MMRAIDVECRTGGCRAAGQVRRVALKLAALGVVELPRLACTYCGGAVAQVGGWRRDDLGEQEDDMPKITVHGGPTNAALDGLVGEHGPELIAVDADGRPLTADRVIAVDEEGGERPSPGSSSPTSPAKPSSTAATSKPARRSPARTTANR